MRHYTTILFILLAVYSCKDKVNIAPSPVSRTSFQQANIDESRAIAVITEGFNLALEQTLNYTPETYAGIIDIEAPYPAYPQTLKFTFRGVKGNDDVVRSGQIIAKFDSAPWKKDAIITLSYANYNVYGVSFTGTQRIVVNNASYTPATQAISHMNFSSTVDGKILEVINKDGWTATWSSNHIWEWSPTQTIIVGSSKGTTRRGFSYKTLIYNDLIKETGCRYVSEGEEIMTAIQDTATVNFGGGSCDYFVNLTFDDTTTEEKLPY